MGVKPRPIPSTGLDHFCWPSGSTPDTIKVFVSGIEYGPTWAPGDGPPPNGYFDMHRTHAASTRWHSGAPNPSFHLDLTPAISHLHGRASGGSSAFWHDDLLETCKKYYNNQAGPFGVDYRHGDAWVTGYEFPWDFADLVMNAYWNDPNFECFPMPNEVLVIRVARIQDATNIKIKVDHNLP